MKNPFLKIFILLMSFVIIFGVLSPLFESLGFIVYPIGSIISLLVYDFFYKVIFGVDDENYDRKQDEIDREKYEREQDELDRRYFKENQPDVDESDESDENSEKCSNNFKYFSKEYFITDIEFDFELDEELNNFFNKVQNMSSRLDENHIMVKPFGFDKYETSSFQIVQDPNTGYKFKFFDIYDKNDNERVIAYLLSEAEILISQIFRGVSEEGITFYYLKIKDDISGKSTQCLISNESIKENLFVQKGKHISTQQFFVQNRNGEIKPIIQGGRIFP